MKRSLLSFFILFLFFGLDIRFPSVRCILPFKERVGTGAVDAAPVADSPFIRVGILPVVESVPFWIAQEKGIFRSLGLNVEIVPFASALERDSAIQSGRIQAAICDLLGLCLFKNRGVPFTVVTNMTVPTPTRALYTLVASPKSKIRTVGALRGAAVGLSSHTIAQYALEGILSREGLKSTEVREVEVKRIPLRFQMLLEGKIDAAIVPEPFGSLALVEGARRLGGDFGLKGTQTILIFQESFIEKHSQAFTLLGRAYGQALGALKINPQSGWDLLVNKGGLPSRIKDIGMGSPLCEVQLPGREDIEGVESWMRAKGMEVPSLGYRDLVNDRWAKDASVSGATR